MSFDFLLGPVQRVYERTDSVICIKKTFALATNSFYCITEHNAFVKVDHDKKLSCVVHCVRSLVQNAREKML